jgi:hypothetical protein
MDAAALRDAIAPLALPEVMRTHGLTTQWRDMYGFDLGDVDAVLAVGQAPDLVLIMPGTYDREALYAIWAANGYQAVEVEETTVWSLSPGDRIDLSAPVSQPSLGLMNTVVVLEDGTLIATARQSRMAATLRAVEGKSPSLLAHGALRDAMAIPEVAGTMSAMLASGSLLEVPQAAEKDAIATSPATAAAVMTEESPPPVELVLFTMTPAREGDAITMTLLYDDSPDAIGTVRDALVDHARTDPVWSARYHIDHALVRGDRNLISVQVTGSEGRGIGFEIVDPRELTPFRWSAGT